MSSKTFALETLFLGGGGEPKGDTTIFDQSLQEFAKVKKTLSLDVTASFNGGHATTEAIISNELYLPNRSFTTTDYQSLIRTYINKIKNGGISSGEKLLVIVNTHGLPQAEGDETHKILTNETQVYNNTGVIPTLDGAVSMDSLKELITVAREKNIKLGLIDFSCHSGNSIKLADDNTCVISAAGPNNYAFSSFPTYFFRQIGRGKSLEDIFLQARSDENSTAFPMISSDIGKKVDQKIYDLFSPYLLFREAADGTVYDKLTPYFDSLIAGNNICKRESDFSQLIAEIQALQQIPGKLANESSEVNGLIEGLKTYKKSQDLFLNDINIVDSPLFNTKVIINYGTTKKDNKGHLIYNTSSVTWRDALFAYPDSNLDYFNDRLKTTKNKAERVEILGYIEKLKKISELRASIQQKHPEFGKLDEINKRISTNYQHLQIQAKVVGTLSTKVYEQLYQQEKQKKENMDARDPCRDFVF